MRNPDRSIAVCMVFLIMLAPAVVQANDTATNGGGDTATIGEKPGPIASLFQSVGLMEEVNVPERNFSAPPALVRLEDHRNVPTDRSTAMGKINEHRKRAIKEAAWAVGSREGLAWRYHGINATLEANASVLNDMFPFKSVMLYDGKVRPPIISQGYGTTDYSKKDEIQTVEQTFRIIKHAKLVSSPPSWRDYLIRKRYNGGATINETLKPQTKAEYHLYIEGLRDGWKSGVKQANRIFKRQIARLRRHFTGIVRFHILREQDMVSVPYVTAEQLGIRVRNDLVEVGQKKFELRVPASFEKATKWKPGFGNNDAETDLNEKDRDW